MKKIPIVLCIDVEPDDRAIDPNVRKDWVGFEQSFEFYRKLRPRIERLTCSPVHFSWFFRMDPQVELVYGDPAWAASRYHRLIEELGKAGDEFGLHTHAWRWDKVTSRWFADMRDQKWVDHCVRMSFEAFQKSFNRPCLSFRFGDTWINNKTLDLIERLGARFDLTLEPGLKRLLIPEHFVGSAPDFTRVPRQPYHPSKFDFRKRGVWRKRGIWMIPLSTGNMDCALTPLNRNGAERSSSERNPGESPFRERASLSVTNPDSAYEGYLDRIDCQIIAGWAYDAAQPDRPVDIEVYDGEALLAAVPASIFRPDLVVAGKGRGKHAFYILFPEWLKDGKPHSLRLKIAGSDFELNQSPAEIKCNKAYCDPETITLFLDADSWVMSRITETLLNAQENPYLALVARSSAVIHPYQRSKLEENLSYILSHPLVSRFVFETPAELIRRVE
ncbi:MAG TPA: hypothetical protein VGX92_22235 [Pyrinomonadaceae bacterium]|jgi:hypothetical protein|nr:hypothetical protein [Pyrinomonadaceae bacterium]